MGFNSGFKGLNEEVLTYLCARESKPQLPNTLEFQCHQGSRSYQGRLEQHTKGSSRARGRLSQEIFQLGPGQTASSVGVKTWPHASPLLKSGKDITLPPS